MGATLSARVQWAANSAAGKPTESTAALQTSVTNKDLFYELIHLIDTIANGHPAEAKAEFRRPLQWTSISLRPSHFANAGGTAAGWNIVNSGPKYVENTLYGSLRTEKR